MPSEDYSDIHVIKKLVFACQVRHLCHLIFDFRLYIKVLQLEQLLHERVRLNRNTSGLFMMTLNGTSHRIAMAFAVAGLSAKGDTRIHEAECADVSFPGFWQALRSVTQ